MPVLNLEQIKEIIPHRDPFLLIDEIVELEPGVLTIEMLAQTGAVCALSLPENRGKIAFFAGIDKARFRGKAVPGDTLTLEVEVTKTVHGVSFCKGVATVNGKRIVTAEFSSVLGE